MSGQNGNLLTTFRGRSNNYSPRLSSAATDHLCVFWCIVILDSSLSSRVNFQSLLKTTQSVSRAKITVKVRKEKDTNDVEETKVIGKDIAMNAANSFLSHMKRCVLQAA